MAAVSEERDPAFSTFLKTLETCISRQKYFIENAFTDSVNEVMTAMREKRLFDMPYLQVDSRTSPDRGAHWIRSIHHKHHRWTIYYVDDATTNPSTEAVQQLYMLPCMDKVFTLFFHGVDGSELSFLLADPEDHFMRMSYEC